MRKPFFYAVLFAGLMSVSVASHAQTETILHNFSGGDGSGPSGALIQASDGNLYGGTTLGGSGAYGVIYKVNATGSSFSNLYSFDNSDTGSEPEAQLIEGSDGNLYGATTATVFKLTPGGVITTLAEPSGNPTGLIPASDGNYYFVTGFGSTIYKITASTGVVTALGTAPGFNLYGLLQASDGNLYGAELGGGPSGDSTIFKCTLDGVVSVLYTFPSTLYPTGALVEGADGQLYGSAGDNTQATAGQIYKVATSTGNYTTVVTIPNGDDIQTPGQLMIASDGNFYGVAQGNSDSRYLVKLTPGGTLTLPITIDNPGELNSPLIQGSDGALYGTGANGGTSSDGAVYKLAFTPALAAPITLALGAGSIVQGKSTTLDWSVSGVYGGSAAYCFASGGDSEWSGVKGTSGQITLTPAAVGSFTYALTCGGTISNSVTLTVTSNGKVNTTAALSASPNPVTIGDTETLTATVKASSGSTVPGGTVTFGAAGLTLGSAALNSKGVATFSFSTTGATAGSYSVTATYSGSSSFNGSVSPAVSLTLTSKIGTTVKVTAIPSGVVEGGSISVKATVTPVSGTGTPSGNVTFTADGLALGTYALSGGTAQFTGVTSGIQPGTYTVVAAYNGSSSNLASTGSTSVVVQWKTATALTASPNPVVQGGSATLTATVTRVGGSGVATGKVTFSVGPEVLGTAMLSGGSASLTASTSSVGKGTYPVSATYAGDTNDGGSSSPVVDVTVE